MMCLIFVLDRRIWVGMLSTSVPFWCLKLKKTRCTWEKIRRKTSIELWSFHRASPFVALSRMCTLWNQFRAVELVVIVTTSFSTRNLWQPIRGKLTERPRAEHLVAKELLNQSSYLEVAGSNPSLAVFFTQFWRCFFTFSIRRQSCKESEFYCIGR